MASTRSALFALLACGLVRADPNLRAVGLVPRSIRSYALNATSNNNNFLRNDVFLQCDNGQVCPGDVPCCNSNEGMACCPDGSWFCCNDNLGCCPGGTRCCPGSCTCARGGNPCPAPQGVTTCPNTGGGPGPTWPNAPAAPPAGGAPPAPAAAPAAGGGGGAGCVAPAVAPRGADMSDAMDNPGNPCGLSISFNGQGVPFGSTVTAGQTQGSPYVSYGTLDPSKLYTLLTFDPDANPPSFVHGLGWNIQGTARSNADGMEFLRIGNNGWTPVGPPACQTHRYIVVLMEQPGRISVGGVGQSGFSVRGFIGQYGLTPKCATLFYGHL